MSTLAKSQSYKVMDLELPLGGRDVKQRQVLSVKNISIGHTLCTLKYQRLCLSFLNNTILAQPEITLPEVIMQVRTVGISSKSHLMKSHMIPS